MASILILFGVLAGAVVLLSVILLRRGGDRTQNVEGLLIEQAARERAHHNRTSFNSLGAHNAPPTVGDSHHR